MRKDHTWAIPPCSSLIIFEKLLPFFFFFFLLQIFFSPPSLVPQKDQCFPLKTPEPQAPPFQTSLSPPSLWQQVYLPGQAITCFPVSAVSNMASFISSMASLVAGPTHGERSPLLLSGAASSSNIYKKTKYPLALQRGSTNMPLFGRVHECKEYEYWNEKKAWIVSGKKWTLPKNQGDPHRDTRKTRIHSGW